MYLIEIFLPTFDNSGELFPKVEYERVRRELTERFGGVTAFMRSPAIGLWANDAGQIRRDEIAIFEVMVESFDRDWWHRYREELELRFRQESLVMRSISFERL